MAADLRSWFGNFPGSVPQVLAQQQPSLRVEDPHLEVVPLDGDDLADVPRRYGVVGAGYLDVPVEVHGAVAVLVERKGSTGSG